MKRATGFTLIFIISCLLSVFPAFAGDWKQTDEDEWQYILDDGSKATGWLELDGHYFYLDSDGNRNEDRWIKDKGSWYYLAEDGILATDQWVDNYYVDTQGKMMKKR
jgi:glucan-binding YG repeat protein